MVVPDSITFLCSATGVPAPTISWYSPRDRELTNNNSTSHIITGYIESGVSISVLTVTAAAGEDAGVYNCTAVNSAGSDSATFYLLVLGKLH